VSAELLSQEHSESNAQTKCDDKLVGLTKVLARGWDDETGESCCFEIGLALDPWVMTLSTLFHGVVPAVSNLEGSASDAVGFIRLPKAKPRSAPNRQDSQMTTACWIGDELDIAV